MHNENPFLKIPDPYEDVKKTQTDGSKQQLEMMRLCWNVFHLNEDGKELMKIFRERYLTCALVRPDHPQADQLNMFWEGFRECIRGFYNLGLQHQQYVTGVNTNGREPTNPTGST